MSWSPISAGDRGYGAAWQRLRQRVLARDLGLCSSCARQGRTTAANCVDHIRPRAQGGTDDMANLSSLCDPCHQTKTALETGKRIRPRIGLDGWPVAEVAVYRGPLWRHGKQVAA